MDPHKSKPKRGPPESLKSDWSKDWDVDFQRARMDRSSSEPQPGSECVSLKSDWSKDWDVDFKRARMDQSNSEPQPGSQCVSLKSDWSKDWDVDFKRSSEVPGPSLTGVSPKSDQFKDKGLLFKAAVPDQGLKLEPEGTSEECPRLDSVFARLEEEIMIFVKEQLKRFHRVLASDYPECSECENEELSSREAVLNITLDFLKKMNQEDLAERLHSKSAGAVCSKLKRCLQQKFSYVFEGVAKAGNPAPLNQIYTELHITEGGAAEVNHEHEVRHIETTFMNEAAPETTIKCEDIFKGPTHRKGPIRAELTERPIRTVLTKGVAGVGKTVLTQKFSLDWAEGRANQNLQLLFPFTFRELNMLRDTQFSLVELLHHFFSESKKLNSFQQLQVLFIFDGLDECRIPLDFGQTRVLTDPTESVSVGVLLVNLIRGSLLPSARLWLTTRPAAASQIPAECVSMVTEVRGFTDLQKEHYFKKRFRNMRQATAVISHIKSIRSLHIMCHIPVFCWILCAVIQKLLEQTVDPKLPHTLTELYIHFLVVQAKVKNCKYDGRSETDPHWTPETREMVLSLGKLAFEQLQKGNLIFYECDLSECGLDAAEVARYSGVFTQVFREESGLYQDKVYCFIHLSVQEFLAALHVHLTFYNSGVNLLSTEQISERPRSEAAFYHSAVDKALQSPNGHLDLFLRFFLGLSLPTNQSLLPGLVTKTGRVSEISQETVKYIKKKLDEGLSSDRSLNLFHCVNELNDFSLVDQIQKNVRGGHFSDRQMSPADWSAVAFLLLSSDSYLEEFDLRKYQASEEVLLRLLPVIKASTKAIVAHCDLTPHTCGLLASVLSSYSLTHLDLSNNNLQDPGVEQLCSGLRTAPCRLRTLKLSGCLVSERGGAYLASALSSAHSHLRELDLSYNHPGPSAELLTALRDDPHCPLDSLRLDPTGEQWMVPGLKKYAWDFSLDPNTAHRKLRLSKNNRAVTHVEEDQQHPDHADRFKDQPQVLSSTGLTGRCYWEVDWSGEWVDIAVSYRGIHKITEDSRFGDNDQSWSLRMEGGLLVKYSVCHSEKETQVSSEWFLSGPVGVFLDVEAGSLSFYKVLSDGDLFHLYTFDSTFTEPLFPGFGLRSVGSSMTLIDSDVESVTTLSQSLKNLEKWSKSRGTD